MKRVFSIFLCLLLSVSAANSSEPSSSRYSIVSGWGLFTAGMFLPDRSSDYGSALMVLMNLNTTQKFNLGFRIMHGFSDGFTTSGPIFTNDKRFFVYNRYGLIISKPLKFGQTHEIDLGSGIVICQTKTIDPYLYVSGNRLFGTISNQTIWDIGLDINLNYKYTFQNNFLVGIYASTVYVWSFDIEGLLLTPIIGVRF